MDLISLPKIELHSHLDCCLSFDAVHKIDPTVTRDDYDRRFVAPPKCATLAEYLAYTFNYRNQPVRVFGTVQNAFTLTGYSGVDPTAGLNGLDNNIYPRSRTFTGGLSIRF